MQALRGDTAYTDDQFQQDMQEAGIYIPDAYKYTPRVATHVMDEIHKSSCQGLQSVINPGTSQPYTPEEARQEADMLRMESRKKFNDLLK